MNPTTDWKQELTASERYDNISKLKKYLSVGGLGGNIQKTAFERELDAFNSSLSRSAYDALCNPDTLTEPNGKSPFSETLSSPKSPGITIDLLSTSRNGLDIRTTKKIFKDLFSGLAYLHAEQIIHRDISPSNILLPRDINGSDPIIITDFGTAWHPSISSSAEPVDQKCLEVGTTCYRGPETLFSNTSYTTSLDLWSTGVLLAECLRSPPTPLLESRRGDEDGNQLGLILSMFKTLGTPTEKTWPEAMKWKTNPFQWWNIFPSKSWDELLPNVEEDGKDLVANLVIYESGDRLTADQSLNHAFFVEKLNSNH
ncbi:hypothetical protein EYC84_011262 [Monilinia fructicola]|uniref:EKC/KEOPS complex subunit BUD32 n=1 Tax=Monilinia fructicola TaxID=38448 RepID=A0A5M9J4V9_MONFR|nr:hypothetical protein EYC84_011262 [Monilinia fructicola]